MDGDYLIPPKATAWCKARKVPVINEALQRELVRVAEAAVRAIHDDDGEIPREVRVYYQALKYVAAVAGAPEGRKWYGYGTEGVAGKETGLTTEQLKAAETLNAKVLRLMRSGCDDMTLFAKMSVNDMADFRWLMDTTSEEGLNELCRQFEGFGHHARVLETVAQDLAAGTVAGG